jgi:hypothetical protein
MQGSFQNRVMEKSKQPDPVVVGMGVTRCGYSDRHPFTVIEVLSPRRIVVQEDKATRTDKNGMSESQSYDYERDPNGTTYTLTLRKNGRWVTQGESMNGGTGWMVGERLKYHDFSF